MKILKFLAYTFGLIAYGLLCSCIALCINDEAIVSKIESNLGDNLGDFMSGTIGIFLAFVSTIFLFITFKAQQKQSKEAKDDAFRARFEGTFFNMLSMYYNVRAEGDKQIRQFSKCGSNNMSEFYVRFKQYYSEMLKRNEDFASAMIALEEDPMPKTKMQTALYDLGNLYDEYVKEQECNAGFYFRYVHNLILFVLKHWEGKSEDIHTYLNFIQSEMSDEELGLLFYDCISNKGQDKNHQYRFKQNLDDNSFLENVSEQTLLSRTHYKLFPKTNFRFLNDDERKLVVVTSQHDIELTPLKRYKG